MKKKRLSIGKAAKILGVSIDTLRRWDKQGKLRSFRVSAKGHRYYSEQDLFLFWHDLLDLAEEWVERKSGVPPEPNLYCPTSDLFQSRLVKMQNVLANVENLSTPFSLIVALIGEIGNNSFDHNLGNWRDLPGIFFGYNLNKRHIVLADRGQGVLKTLHRVKPELKSDAEAVRVAFTEIISGRAPESRGNGLKYVKGIVIQYPLSLVFETGSAKLLLKEGDQELNLEEKIPPLLGCIAMLQF